MGKVERKPFFFIFTKLKNHLYPAAANFDDDLRRRNLLCGISLVGIFFLLLLGSLAYLQGDMVIGSLDFFVATSLITLLWLLLVKGYLQFCIYCSVALMFFLFLYLFVTGGVAGNAFLWSFIFPLISFFLLGTLHGTLVVLLYFISCIFILLLDLNTAYSFGLYTKDFAFRFIPSFSAVTCCAFLYEKLRKSAQMALIQLNNDLEQLVASRTKELQLEVIKKTKAQQEAIQAKKIWERTFNAVPEEILILDPDFRIIRANNAITKAMDVSYPELINTKCYHSIDGKEKPPVHCPYVKLLENHKTQHLEYFDDYTQRYLSVTVSPLYNGKGTFLGAVRVAHDITDQKNARIEQKAIRAQLRKSEKMEAIGLMAGGVAHDLNNILSGVVSYPEMLLLKLSEEDEFHKHITLIHDAGKHAAAVVDDLLTVARGAATEKKYSSLNSLAREYFDSLEFNNTQSYSPLIDVKFTPDPDLWNINCSPVHIQKLFMNLVTNGVEAIDSSGCVHVSTANETIKTNTIASSLVAGQYAVLTVHDTGKGISKKDIGKIFEPFYTKKTLGRSGTGLGLAVVWNIVKDHKAEVFVKSDSEGTTFTLYFPAYPKDEILSEGTVNIDTLHGTGSILIVDDKLKQREMASQMLEYLGYVTTSVPSGEAAIEFIQNHSVDLVLLDMLMEPGINGRQTYEKLIKISPGQKAIIVSGFSESYDMTIALKLGVGCYIKKPYSLKSLGIAVKSELSVN